jgi:hypothetical protein
VQRFAEFCLDVTPRFTPDGRLLLDGGTSGRILTLNGGSAVTAQTFAQERYGVVGRAIVKNRARGTSVTVENTEPLSAGGCVRVVKRARQTGFDALRYKAPTEIRPERAGCRPPAADAAQCFAAFPGDTEILEETPQGCRALFVMRDARFGERPGE